MHLVTVPLTYVAADMVGQLAEIVPIAVEYSFLVWCIHRSNIGNWLGHLPARRRIFTAVLSGNLTTFLLGLLVIFGLGPEPPPSVSRVKSDLRSLETGVEYYALDHSSYPSQLTNLTTPVSYLLSLPDDPHLKSNSDSDPTYRYVAHGSPEGDEGVFILWGTGPDGVYDLEVEEARNILKRNAGNRDAVVEAIAPYIYDPYRGRNSPGDVFSRFFTRYPEASVDRKRFIRNPVNEQSSDAQSWRDADWGRQYRYVDSIEVQGEVTTHTTVIFTWLSGVNPIRDVLTSAPLHRERVRLFYQGEYAPVFCYRDVSTTEVLAIMETGGDDSVSGLDEMFEPLIQNYRPSDRGYAGSVVGITYWSNGQVRTLAIYSPSLEYGFPLMFDNQETLAAEPFRRLIISIEQNYTSFHRL